MQYVTVTDKEFEDLRDFGDLEPEVCYEVREEFYGATSIQWAWSPDGEGVYWYDTLEDFEENHGE